MKELIIQTPSKSYPVYLGYGAIASLSHILNKGAYSSILLVADEVVFHLHGETVLRHLPTNIPTHICKVPSGEQAKSFSVYEETISVALKKKVDRKAVVVALGGGAIGDMAGFVASTYMRGIAFIQVPSTILAHDSAVGGKVAINHPLGKNMVGQFYQPEAVIYDLDFLTSLPEKEIKSGLSEVIKHSLIADSTFYNQLLSKRNLSEFSGEFLEEILYKGIQIKNTIVSQDERENNIRAFLNFGHTFGHALEKHGNYKTFSHGEAVMIGMVYALRLSQMQGNLVFDFSGFLKWIHQLGYSLKIPPYSFESLLETMKLDKKAEKGHPKFVLLKEIGSPIIEEVHTNKLEEAFQFLKTKVQESGE
ncbi:3-dehydroquinate synthase [Bacillus spongiae]|uniref:3-dehydroquinate synthase n=1 Tax=Bacillus spongiae TaxID=2683610 RepID=A0ABU8HD48_9BACI